MEMMLPKKQQKALRLMLRLTLYPLPATTTTSKLLKSITTTPGTILGDHQLQTRPLRIEWTQPHKPYQKLKNHGKIT
jgi:hypothetical protein